MFANPHDTTSTPVCYMRCPFFMDMRVESFASPIGRTQQLSLCFKLHTEAPATNRRSGCNFLTKCIDFDLLEEGSSKTVVLTQFETGQFWMTFITLYSLYTFMIDSRAR